MPYGISEGFAQSLLVKTKENISIYNSTDTTPKINNSSSPIVATQRTGLSS
jgi:hypothetical protein